MNKTLTASGFALAIGLAGCNGNQPAKLTPAEVDASIQQSFDRLQALQVFSADRLIMNLPAEATACYGLPCDRPKWQPAIDAERARQAPRLSKLADLTEAATKDANLMPRAAYDSQPAVQALQSLQIVDVGSLIQVQPQNNAECYNLPCPSDQQAADRTNGLHVAQAFEIAEAAQKSGL
jgi:hypothetical protein